MRRERRHLYSDPEVVELLQEDPELLAIVDAIAATQGRPRSTSAAARTIRAAAASVFVADPFVQRRRRSGLVALIGATAAVITLVVLAPWQGRGPLATELALAAIGDQPVIHAVVESTRPRATVIDLGSGMASSEFLRTEYWHDEERSRLRLRLTIEGRLQTEILETREGGLSDAGPLRRAPGEPVLDPALAGFASGYREALEAGNARVAGETSVDGQQAVLLQFKVGAPVDGQSLAYEEVAVDAESYRPLRFRFRSGQVTGHWWRVIEIETRARDEQQFVAPASAEPRRTQQTTNIERTLTPNEAAKALQGPAVWPGAAVAGIGLTRIELINVLTSWSDGREREELALRFQYGPRLRAAPSERNLIITETTTADMLPHIGGSSGRYPLAPGQLRISGAGDLDGSPVDIWFGAMKIGDVYVALESPNRDAILAAAKAMAPIS
jgi:hypothetical protein